jgi:hypothetical protein
MEFGKKKGKKRIDHVDQPWKLSSRFLV